MSSILGYEYDSSDLESEEEYMDYDELKKMSNKEIHKELTEFKEKIERDANMKKDLERWYNKWVEKHCYLISDSKMSIIFENYTKEDFNHFLELENENSLTNYIVNNIAQYKEDFSYVINHYNDKVELCIVQLSRTLRILKPSQEEFKEFLKGKKFNKRFYKYKSLIPDEYEHLIDKHKISQENMTSNEIILEDDISHLI